MRAGFDSRIVAGFLDSGCTLAHLANAAALIAGIGYWWSRGITAVLLGVSLAAWGLESWFAVRVAIDRRLFRALADCPEDGADWLDTLLVDWRFIKAAKSRSTADRISGALRLWRNQSAALALQLAALACAMIIHAVSL